MYKRLTTRSRSLVLRPVIEPTHQEAVCIAELVEEEIVVIHGLNRLLRHPTEATGATRVLTHPDHFDSI